MAKVVETTIDRFDGGITNNPRDARNNVSRMITNFDIFSNPQKLIPRNDTESGDASSSTSKKQNFAVARRTGTTYELFALGVQSGASDAEVLYKSLTTGGANDLDDAAWTTPSNNQQGTGTSVSFDCFVYYQNQDEIYSIRDTQFIQAFSPTGSAWVDSESDLGSGIANIAQGLVHSKDDICYIPYDNKIASKDGSAAFTTAAITFPAHFYISSICEYGNYLAVACTRLSKTGNSRVYLWNRNSSLTTLSESIDWGEGELLVLEEVDGVLIGISIVGNSSIYNTYRVIFRQYVAGVGAVKFAEFTTSANTSVLEKAKQKHDNRLYFMMKIAFNGATREGVWSVGRSSPNQPFAITHELTPDNDTSHASGDLKNFFILGDYFFVSFDDSGFVLNKTQANSYGATSIYESKVFNTGNKDAASSLRKDLVGVAVTHEALPAAGQVDVYYAIDENIEGASWTRILRNSTDNSLSADTTKADTDGDGDFDANLPSNYKEIQFRIESTGNAVITGLTFQERVTGKRTYT